MNTYITSLIMVEKMDRYIDRYKARQIDNRYIKQDR